MPDHVLRHRQTKCVISRETEIHTFYDPADQPMRDDNGHTLKAADRQSLAPCRNFQATCSGFARGLPTAADYSLCAKASENNVCRKACWSKKELEGQDNYHCRT